jgi:phage head maturation protease
VAARIIHHIDDVREVSLVTNPANKHARAQTYSGMDLLTGDSAKAVSRRQKRGAKRRRTHR